MGGITYPDKDLWRSRTDGSEKLRLTFPPVEADLPRWSPHGKQLVFVAGEGTKPGAIYLISSDGGEPHRLLPEGTNGGNPDWSPDGTSVVFGPEPAFPHGPSAGGQTDLAVNSIQILNVKTSKVSELPDSAGLYWPRWAANGNYMEHREVLWVDRGGDHDGITRRGEQDGMSDGFAGGLA